MAIRRVTDEDSLMFISASGMLVRIPAETISRIGRNTMGVRLVNVKDGDRVMTAARVFESASDDDAQ